MDNISKEQMLKEQRKFQKKMARKFGNSHYETAERDNMIESRDCRDRSTPDAV